MSGVASCRVGTADFHYADEFLGLGIERIAQLLHGREQSASGFRGGGDVHGSGEGVVGGLRHVDVIVGMNRLLAAQFAAGDLNGAIGDHFVDVHVGLGAAAGLPDAKREVFIPLSGDDFVCCLSDQVGFFFGELAKIAIDERGGFFQNAKGANQLGRHGVFADGKVNQRARRLCAIVAVHRHFDFAHAVGFNASGNALCKLGGFGHVKNSWSE